MTAGRRSTAAGAALLALAGCAAPAAEAPAAADRPWDDVLAEADGQTVDLWMYGGEEAGNAYVDDVLAPAAAELGVTLRRVPVADTGDALNRVLSERQAGVTDGEVDLVWVNGENYAAGRQAGAWLCDWALDLPNRQYTDPGDPLLTNDFGVPVEGCESPWHKAQFTLVYDSARVPEPPTTLAGVLDWAQANPGRFTYPAPPDFTGSMAVRTFFFDQAGGPDAFLEDFDEQAYGDAAPALWDRLNALEPALWREGSTYPADQGEVQALFAGDEIDAYLTYGSSAIGGLVEKGELPETTRSAVFEAGNIGNYSFTAIPYNAGDAEAAMVLADLLLSPEAALVNAGPDGAGFTSAIDLSRLPEDQAAEFEQLQQSPYQVPPAELAAATLPEVSAEYVNRLEKDWKANVLQK